MTAGREPGAPIERPTARAYSPGRVNLIGDHTDYNDGLALPMAIDMGTTAVYRNDGTSLLRAASSVEPEVVEIDLRSRLGPERLQLRGPPWARLVAAVASVVGPVDGGTLAIESNLPVGAGLSSSAALEVSVALALGADPHPTSLARMCQRAEQAATKVPSGLMDQLTVAAGRVGRALLIDFARLSLREVALPEQAEILVVHSGHSRTLAGSKYSERRNQCTAASDLFDGRPLAQLSIEDTRRIEDPILRRRARHVVTECSRVRDCAEALEHGDLREAGRLMTESHRSLAQDFEVSTRPLDELVEDLLSIPGVLGARLTGAGFGGCVVALAEPATHGALHGAMRSLRAWRVSASDGARLLAS